MDSQRTTEAHEYAYWQTVVDHVLTDVVDQASCFSELHEWFARPTAWRCFDDVGPTLSALRDRGFQVAIASNFDVRLHSVCDGLPELRDIAIRIISSEVGWRKPHAGFYRALTEACGGDPAQIVMVGDDRRNDLEGANRAGLRALLIERHNSTDTAGSEFSVIRSLLELMES